MPAQNILKSRSIRTAPKFIWPKSGYPVPFDLLQDFDGFTCEIGREGVVGCGMLHRTIREAQLCCDEREIRDDRITGEPIAVAEKRPGLFQVVSTAQALKESFHWWSDEFLGKKIERKLSAAQRLDDLRRAVGHKAFVAIVENAESMTHRDWKHRDGHQAKLSNLALANAVTALGATTARPGFTCTEHVRGRMAMACGTFHPELRDAVLCWAKNGLTLNGAFDGRTITFAIERGTAIDLIWHGFTINDPDAVVMNVYMAYLEAICPGWHDHENDVIDFARIVKTIEGSGRIAEVVAAPESIAA